MGLEGTTEEPHHHFSSFRVGGKIYVTIPPEEDRIHVFVPGPIREPALELHGDYCEELPWGKKIVGLRVFLEHADREVVKRLVRAAWATKTAKG